MSGGFPTPVQALLLRACLKDDDDALAAWIAWRDRVDLDALDAGSIRLLPLLTDRLSALGVEDDAQGRYRGVQRRAWAENQLLFRTAERAAGNLVEAGIPVIALKGLPLALRYYRSSSLRPMGDIDFMVHERDAIAAVASLERQGWRAASSPPRDALDLVLHNSVAMTEGGDGAREVDLHWRLRPTSFAREAVDAMWRAAEPLELGPVTIAMPSAADLLMHVCAHGVSFNALPPHRWVADAAMVLRAGNVDWDHFVAQARRFELSLPLAAALAYLADAMQIDIPESVRTQLAAAQVRPVDRFLFAIDQVPFDKRRFPELIRLHMHIVRRGLGPKPASYLRYFARLRDGRSQRATLSWIAKRMTQGRRA